MLRIPETHPVIYKQHAQWLSHNNGLKAIPKELSFHHNTYPGELDQPAREMRYFSYQTAKPICISEPVAGD